MNRRRAITVTSTTIALIGVLSGSVSAAGVGTFGGLASPVCVSLGVIIGLAFVPMDTLQAAIISRLEG